MYRAVAEDLAPEAVVIFIHANAAPLGVRIRIYFRIHGVGFVRGSVYLGDDLTGCQGLVTSLGL